MNSLQINKRIALICSSFIILLSGCIVMTPLRGKTDMSESFNPNDSTHFAYMEVSAMEIKERFPKNDTVVVNLFAPWCPYSYVNIVEKKYLVESDFKSFFVCTNYDVKSIEKHFKDYLPTDTIYFISAKVYGNDESQKTEHFISELTQQPIDSVSSGVPQHFLLHNGALIQKSVKVLP